MFLTLAAVVFLLISTCESHTLGTVTADSNTFDALVEKFEVVLAKFDDKFPVGEKHDEFKKFAESVGATKNLLLVEILIGPDEEKENGFLGKKYGVRREDYPVYKLFLNGQTTPLDYTGDKSEKDLKRFLSEHTTLWLGLPGTLEALDRLAGEFFQAASAKEETNVNALLDKAREQVKEFVDAKEQKSAQSYLKIMELVVKNGVEFLKREQQRVENILKGKITNEKKQELQHRANILLSFKSLKQSIKDAVINAGEQIKEAVKETIETHGPEL